MTPESWQRLAALYAEEYAKNKTSLKAFCEAQGINYGTAKKYISVRKAAGRDGMKPVEPVKGKGKSLSHGEKVLREKKKSLSKKSLSTKSLKRELRGSKIAEDFGISDREFLFARLVAQGLTKCQAYLDAGYQWRSDTKPYAESSRVARKPRVRRAIYYFKEQIQERYNFEFDEVISQLVAILRADPNEITQYRRVNCRYCYGHDHRYQWRDMEEQQSATALAASNNQPPPDIRGGIGFVENADPHPDCPRCSGEGKGRMFSADTRDIEGDARYLLEGVSMTKLGPTIVTASKSEARKELARIAGIQQPPGETPEVTELRLQILREELRKKKAEADRMEAENALTSSPGGKGGEPTYVIQVVNSPDADDEEADSGEATD